MTFMEISHGRNKPNGMACRSLSLAPNLDVGLGLQDKQAIWNANSHKDLS